MAAAVLGCAATGSQRATTPMDTTQEDFEHLWDYGKPAETEARFRTELARQPAASESHAQLLTQIARTFSLRRDFAAAHALLDQVAARSDAGAAKVRVRYELERGRTFNSVGDKARAKELFVAAWDHANAAHFDFYAIDAAHMMAFVTPPAEQHAWNLEALKLTESTPDLRAKKWLVPLYNNIGWTYHDQNDYAAALAMFDKALAAAEERGRPEPLRVAKWTLARCLRSLGRFDEALRQQLALRDDPAAASANDGYVFEEIGENLLALGRRTEARGSFASAHALLKDDAHLKAGAPERLARLRELAGAP